MTQLDHQPDTTADCFPLSLAQEWWLQGDQGDWAGSFNQHFIQSGALRIAGRIQLEALQGALDDVVVRHEALRTVVVRHPEPPCQQLYPPCAVPLEVRDLPCSAAKSRQVVAEELLSEAEQGIPINPREVPLLRAILGRFDDTDSVLVLIVHHSATDGWSTDLIMHDLAAFYTARTTGIETELPTVPQYREYAAWQHASLARSTTDDALDYWRQKLAGAQIFTLPTDRPMREAYTRPYSAHFFTIDAHLVAGISELAKAMRSSTFMVLLAAFNVLAHRVTGTADPLVYSPTAGRSEPQFHETVGVFLSMLPLRTQIGGCETFREVVVCTRDTCVEAYAHEIPIYRIEQEMPELMPANYRPWRSANIFGMYQSQFDSEVLEIAEGARNIVQHALPQQEANSDIPIGLAWEMELQPSGELTGLIRFNLDDLDESTVAGWLSDYRRILSRAIAEPDRRWKTL